MEQILNFVNGAWTFSDTVSMKVLLFWKTRSVIKIIYNKAENTYQKYIDATEI